MPATPSFRALRRGSSPRWRQGAGGLCALALFAGGCSSASAGGGGDQPPAGPVVDLVSDTNRNGLLDSGADDETGEETWDAKHGAVVLANLDDDDADGKQDATTDQVDGDSDTRDLSPLLVRAWPQAPEGTQAKVTVTLGAAQVRLFRVNGSPERASSYTAADPVQGVTLTAADLRAGAPLAIEAKSLALSRQAAGWDGNIRLLLQVTDATGKEVGHDEVALRVAPLLFQYNTAKTERVFYTEGGADTKTLADGIHVAAQLAGGVPVTSLHLSMNDWDQWTQDFFDLGYTLRPGPDGQPVGMRIAVRSAQPDRTSGDKTTKSMTAPDVGRVYVHTNGLDANSHGYSMNSFGDWDVVPPYTKGAESYPLGRNIFGSGDTAEESPDPAFVEFVRAQKVQPEIVVDSSWLVVGHVDEFLSFAQAKNARGWQLLAARPSLSRQMLQQLQQAGHGGELMFAGRMTYDYNSDSENTIPAQASIDQVLADADRMAASQEAEVKIDAVVTQLKGEIGLADSEVTDIPVLFEQIYGQLIAYQPGAVNMLHVDGKAVVPKPFGPTIDGADPFETDLRQRLEALGLNVTFADDWDTYHINMGEVHCGSNVSRTMNLAWWESGR